MNLHVNGDLLHLCLDLHEFSPIPFPPAWPSCSKNVCPLSSDKTCYLEILLIYQTTHLSIMDPCEEPHKENPGIRHTGHKVEEMPTRSCCPVRSCSSPYTCPHLQSPHASQELKGETSATGCERHTPPSHDPPPTPPISLPPSSGICGVTVEGVEEALTVVEAVMI